MVWFAFNVLDDEFNKDLIKNANNPHLTRHIGKLNVFTFFWGGGGGGL